MMVSVAMCTYNGAKYLRQQLESIAKQTVPVNELVVCDDGSVDDTIQIIREFSKTSSFSVSIHINEKNLGSTKNFEKCLLLCKGEIIFLCDQDDIWRQDKVEKQLKYFQENPGKDAVFSDAEMINGSSQPTGRTIWQEIEFDKSLQNKWIEGKSHEIMFKGYIVTGATLAIRKACLARLTPFPTNVKDLIHDAWIAMVLGLEDKIGFIAESLISYRMHESQQVGFGGNTEFVTVKNRFTRDRKQKLDPIKERGDKLHGTYLLLQAVPFVPKEKLTKLYEAQEHFYKRASLPDNRLLRVIPVFGQFVRGNYAYSSKDWWLPLVGDLIE